MSVSHRGRFGQFVSRLHMVVLWFLMVGAIPAAAQAQGTRDSHWGIGASWTPNWTLLKSVKNVIFEGDGTIKGSEFTVGIVRGSTRGGDWGVSFVRKPFKDGSGETKTKQQCFNPAQTQCAPDVTSTLSQGVYLNGVEVHKFIAFVTIKNRVQIGLNVGGGVAMVKGNVVKTEDGFQPVSFDPRTGLATLAPVHTVNTVLAKDEWLPIFPLFKLEAEGAFILAPGLKVKIAGGLNFPSVGARIGVVYLIGAK
jgi:hypothetical protein